MTTAERLDAAKEIIPELTNLLHKADHVDVKTFTGSPSLSEFVARMLTYEPGWLQGLYKARRVLAELMGLRQAEFKHDEFTADDVEFTPGAQARFFSVVAGNPQHYWMAKATDKHLAGYIAVAAEPAGGGAVRFHVLTVVRYRHWTGPVYFNLIRPFHHLVVHGMGKYAAAGRD